jgi:hypothetical protein
MATDCTALSGTLASRAEFRPLHGRTRRVLLAAPEAFWKRASKTTWPSLAVRPSKARTIWRTSELGPVVEFW